MSHRDGNAVRQCEIAGVRCNNDGFVDVVTVEHWKEPSSLHNSGISKTIRLEDDFQNFELCKEHFAKNNIPPKSWRKMMSCRIARMREWTATHMECLFDDLGVRFSSGEKEMTKTDCDHISHGLKCERDDPLECWNTETVKEWELDDPEVVNDDEEWLKLWHCDTWPCLSFTVSGGFAQQSGKIKTPLASKYKTHLFTFCAEV